MDISLGFSPCPNDTFIFDALVNNKIDTEGFKFNAVLEDVQTLNEMALTQVLDVTKLSYAVLPLVNRNYTLLNSGSALGTGVGPMLIAADETRKVEEYLIAIPGEHTTAHLLFSLAYPNAKNKVFIRYDEIEDFVLSGKGLGVIIHENRFTYHEKGLKKIMDLGDNWEQQTGSPIPLGGIVIRNDLTNKIGAQVDKLIKKSIEFAFSVYPTLNDYIRNNAQEMNEDVMRKHIDLYVNSYSLDLGVKGRNAVKKLLEVYSEMNGNSIEQDKYLM